MAKSKDPEIEIKARINGADNWKEWCKSKSKSNGSSSSGGNALYCVGSVGALVYNVQAAIGFGAIITGILKAAIWPAIVVYKLLEVFYGAVV